MNKRGWEPFANMLIFQSIFTPVEGNLDIAAYPQITPKYTSGIRKDTASKVSDVSNQHRSNCDTCSEFSQIVRLNSKYLF